MSEEKTINKIPKILTKSIRVRQFTVEQHKVALVPQSGNSFTNNPNLI